MAAWRILLLGAFLLGAPAAVADSDLPIPPTCIPPVEVGPLANVALCTPRSCDPAFDCTLATTPATTRCADNATIEGETCQAALDVGVARPTEGTAVRAHVEQSDGFVDAFNLPNSWASPSANVAASALGADLGSTTVAFYRSDIVSSDHAWTELGVGVRHDGPAGSEGVLVAVWLMDEIPDGCVVRTQGGAEDAVPAAAQGTPAKDAFYRGSLCPSLVMARNLIPPLP